LFSREVFVREVALTEKLALSVAEVSELTGVCRSQIYLAVSAGSLLARKRGTSTLILADDLKSWLAGLPTFGNDDKGHRRGAAATVARRAKAAQRRAQAAA
jgi:excisionase family DNA binding protein